MTGARDPLRAPSSMTTTIQGEGRRTEMLSEFFRSMRKALNRWYFRTWPQQTHEVIPAQRRPDLRLRRMSEASRG